MKVNIKDIVLYVLWLFLAFIVFNYIKILALPFLVVLAYKYIVAKDEVAYLIVFLAMIANLGGLFGGNVINIIKVGFFKLDIVVVFILVNYVKYLLLSKKSKNIFLFNRPIQIYYIYFFLLLFLGYVIGINEAGNSGFRHYFLILNIIVLIPILYVLPRVLTYNNFISRIALLFFVSIIINILGQGFMLIKGVAVSNFINPSLFGHLSSHSNYMEDSLRPLFGQWFAFFALFLSFFFIVKKRSFFNRTLLYAVIFFSFISIFITATRGWILAFLFFIIVSSTVFSYRIAKKITGFAILAIIFFIVLYNTSQLFRVQMDKSFKRFATVELMFEGDLSAGGTNVRYIRGKRVMQGFYQSPIFGIGFSSEGISLADQHVGNQDILMSGGIVGYLIILYFVLYISIWSVKIGQFGQFIDYNREFLLIPILLASIFIVHSTSTTIYGYVIYTRAYGNMLMLVLAIGIINKMIIEYIDEKRKVLISDY